MGNFKKSKKTKGKYSKLRNNYKKNKKSNKSNKNIKKNKKILKTKKYKVIGGMKYMIYDGKKTVFKYIELLKK